jgi:hypothetical protein
MIPKALPQYKFTWGVNTVVVIGADTTDVVFTHEDPNIQTVNITRILQAINDKSIPFRKISAVLDFTNVKAMLADRDIDSKRVQEIKDNLDLYHSPVLFVGSPPDLTLIDGTHRLYCRYYNREDYIMAYVISYKTLNNFKVKFWVNGELIRDSRDTILKTFTHAKPKEEMP